MAFQYGVTQKYIKKRMALAGVLEPILEAFKKDDIDIDAVMAFTVIPSQDEQIKCIKPVRRKECLLILLSTDW